VPATRVTRVASIESRSASPWSSIPSLYAGPIPLRSQPEAQIVVRIYRVQRGFQASGGAVRTRVEGEGRDRAGEVDAARPDSRSGLGTSDER